MIFLNSTDYFSSEEKWLKNKEKTLFKSIEDVEKYQNKRLKFIKQFHANLYCENLQKNPNKLNVKCKNYMQLTRSGTTSLNNNRSYYYSLPEQMIMENHHFWKIEKLHSLLEPGKIIWICPTDPGGADESGLVLGNPKRDRIYGPSKKISVGCKNDVYSLYYNAKFKKEHWEHNLNLLYKYSPIKLLRTSPSVIQTIYYYFKDRYKFEFPVVLSEETLHEQVRFMAESIFSKVIDKCVCWDGCLGWFECPCKIKHIYDEFCIIKELNNNVLAVTDLHNLASPFINYINGDRGSVGKIDCDCGLSGFYFKSFEGKIVESIYVKNEGKDMYLPGRYISEKLSGFFRLNENYDIDGDNAAKDLNFSNFTRNVKIPDNFIYRLMQKENLEIDFTYDCDNVLCDLQKKRIIDFLNIIIWQNKDCKKINFIKDSNIFSKKTSRSKCLCIESDFIKLNLINKNITF